MTPENEQKKRYLLQYQWGKVELKQVESDIIRMQLEALPSAITYDGMPHGSGGTNTADLSNYAAKLDAMRDHYRAKRDEILEKLEEIDRAISAIPEAKYRILLRERYINLNGIRLKSWSEIASVINYTEESAKNLHGEALKAFVIPDN